MPIFSSTEGMSPGFWTHSVNWLVWGTLVEKLLHMMHCFAQLKVADTRVYRYCQANWSGKLYLISLYIYCIVVDAVHFLLLRKFFLFLCPTEWVYDTKITFFYSILDIFSLFKVFIFMSLVIFWNTGIGVKCTSEMKFYNISLPQAN